MVGLQLRSGSVTVAAFDDAHGAAAREAGLRIGDEITAINGNSVGCIEDVRLALEKAEDGVQVTVCRGGEVSTVPVKLNRQKLGVYLRQGIAGIGVDGKVGGLVVDPPVVLIRLPLVASLAIWMGEVWMAV